ncbi:beta-galactosidase [Cryobacterium psychrophilum]|uniref:Beta-galactosidase n=1 Tax=Cryobacterium psychrophilum TaxID=41988 RepID=A0A4Y8KNR9_9MICO|nr:beta-galactosidase [Cryobacterium psychrophilum]TDW29277.1 beta-galactosidase [Cryobacterium psychrophilum]TFD79956.1 beta-galactosidase [Cryobacterium psychrophilum]
MYTPAATQGDVDEATRATPFVQTGIAYGCDYNPEQWGPDVWAEDVLLMQQSGVDLVAINIFGWSSLEPRQGEYDFTLLDTVIDLLHSHGIRVNLGTGTSSPPPWLTTAHPEILPQAEDGTTRYSGGRQAWCPSSPVFREHALRLVEQVARRYGAHPAVALWHVSNELGCHNALCYDDDTAAAFRRWLEARYGSIAALNAAWGTSFWSQRYGAWGEVHTPRLTLSSRNPGQVLDFHRFSSDELLGYYRAEEAVIRRHSRVPVTTNFMVTAHIRNLDYWSWASAVDVVANDHYLDHRLDDPTTELAFAADLSRGLANGGAWLLMEQATSAVNWQPLNVAKAPGEMTRNSLSHVARGAEAVCFFQWRASQQGSEKFHSALVPHSGTDTVLWREVVELGATLDRLDEVVGTRVVADCAILFSWEAWWAGDNESRPSTSVKYIEQVHAAYTALHRLGITVDIVSPDADLSGYRLVVVPALYLVTDTQADLLAGFVAAGGHTVVTFYSGIVDEDDRVRLGGYPGAFRTLLGITVEEFAPIAPGRTVRLAAIGAIAETALTGDATGTLWTERLRLAGAEALASYSEGPLTGVPAITRNSHGDGTAWYLATAPDPATYRDLMRTITTTAGVTVAGPENDGLLEVVRRAGNDRSYRFIINHGDTDVDMGANGFELVTGADIIRSLRVPAGAVRVIREDTIS